MFAFVRKLNRSLWMFLALAALLIILGQPTAALAAEFRGDNDITIGSNETIDDDLYAFGQNVAILGTVTGSVIAGGNTVTVGGDVGGDLMAAGSTVLVNGPVHGSVRAAGQSVAINNQVDGDLLATGSTVSLLNGGGVGRDVLAAGTAVTLAGPVGRNVDVSGHDVRISDTVEGHVTTDATYLALDPTARIQGGMSYTSGNEADIAPGATVAGPIVRSAPAAESGAPWSAIAVDWLKGIVGLAVLGLVLVALFPDTARRNTQVLRQSPWASLGLGVVVLLLVPLLAAVVFGAGLLLGGWWLGLMLLAGYAVWLVFGYLVSAATLGGGLLVRLRQTPGFRLWSLLLGLLVLAGLQFIPFVGWLVAVAAVLFGSGALLLTAWSARRPRWAAPSHATAMSSPNSTSPVTAAAP